MTDPATLPDAIRQLDDAVFELTKTQITRAQGKVFTAPCLWVQMQQAVHGTRNGHTANTVGQSRLPLWADGYMWCRKIDTKVREWLPRKQGHTLTLLLALPEQKWTPAQMADVLKMASAVEQWTKEAARYLGTASELEYLGPCPECGEEMQWRHVDGENVRVPVVTITTEEVRCKECRTSWEPYWFARLIDRPVDEVLAAMRDGHTA